MRILAVFCLFSLLTHAISARADWYICNNHALNGVAEGSYPVPLVPTLVLGGCQPGIQQLFHFASHDDLANIITSITSLESAWNDFPKSENARSVIKQLAEIEAAHFKESIKKEYEDRMTRMEEEISQLQKSRK